MSEVNESVTNPARVQPTVRAAQPDFDTFYRSAWDEVYRPLAVTLQDADLAREAVDEGMIRAYRRWRHVCAYRNQEGWVYRVALNWAISQRRKTRREVTVSAPLKDAAPVDSSLDLYRALGALGAEQRAVVVLRYLLDWPEAEVAGALGIRPGTVKSRLHRAFEKMRKELS